MQRARRSHVPSRVADTDAAGRAAPVHVVGGPPLFGEPHSDLMAVSQHDGANSRDAQSDAPLLLIVRFFARQEVGGLRRHALPPLVGMHAELVAVELKVEVLVTLSDP